MIRNFSVNDLNAITSLWNRRAVIDGYVEHTREGFTNIFLNNKYFSIQHAFVLEEDGGLGFICGCTGDDLPAGNERGYFTCLVLDEQVDTLENTRLLLSYLENSFQAAGKTVSDVLFFNPIHLPWYIPGTKGHQHNNAPGIAVDTKLYSRIIKCGYIERGRESAMYIDLSTFSIPDRIKEKQSALNNSGMYISLYDSSRCFGLSEMLNNLGNPLWISEIEESARKNIPFLVAEVGGQVVGFAGPIYPEKTGRGYFTGIGVTPAWEGKGLGSQLFYYLCEHEKITGARYMSLYTGENNPAKRIYEGAGFITVRSFAILRKELKGEKL